MNNELHGSRQAYWSDFTHIYIYSINYLLVAIFKYIVIHRHIISIFCM